MAGKLRQFTVERPLLRKLIGVLLLIIGFIFLITPMTPGALLIIFLGCEFLGLRFLFLENLKNKIVRRKKSPVQ